MRPGKWIVLALVVIGGMFAFGVWTVNSRMDQQKQYIDSLMVQSDQSLTFDSIRSAIENRVMDSIRVVRVELENERVARRRETKKYRRETEIIRHRIDSIGPIVRPEF